jgi:hypothetical protein
MNDNWHGIIDLNDNSTGEIDISLCSGNAWCVEWGKREHLIYLADEIFGNSHAWNRYPFQLETSFLLVNGDG